MKDHNYFVYMIASRSRILYIGMMNDLHRRVWEHKNDLIEGFSRQYKCHRLVYYELFDDVNKAIDREKQLKRWSRVKKEWLIKQRNPTWETSPLSGTCGISLNLRSRSLPHKLITSQC